MIGGFHRRVAITSSHDHSGENKQQHVVHAETDPSQCSSFHVYTRRQLSRKAAASSAQRPVADIAKNDGPPIRQHCGTVAITSGPPPIKPKAKGGSNGCHNDQLQGDSPTASGSTNNPATNGTLRDSGKTTSHGTNEKSVSAAEHTHDNGYVKWAKFDVDAALREVDGEKNGSEKARLQHNELMRSSSFP